MAQSGQSQETTAATKTTNAAFSVTAAKQQGGRQLRLKRCPLCLRLSRQLFVL